jgi:hypothetical protein
MIMGDTPVRNIRADAVLWNAAQQTAREQDETMTDVLLACLRRYVDSHLTEERLVVTQAEPPRRAVDPYSVVIDHDTQTVRFALYQQTPSGQWRRQRDIPRVPVADLPHELRSLLQDHPTN